MHALVLSHASWGIPDACRRARLEPVFVGDPAEARTHLDHAEPGEIACVLVDASAPGAHRFMEWLRSHPRLLSLPTLFLVEEATTDAFVEAHAAGADDAVVRTDATMIQRRIASLKGFRAKRPDVTQGRALVAISDSRERRLLGRYVRWAGFDPCFAETLEELLALEKTYRLQADLKATSMCGVAVVQVRNPPLSSPFAVICACPTPPHPRTPLGPSSRLTFL